MSSVNTRVDFKVNVAKFQEQIAKIGFTLSEFSWAFQRFKGTGVYSDRQIRNLDTVIEMSK